MSKKFLLIECKHLKIISIIVFQCDIMENGHHVLEVLVDMHYLHAIHNCISQMKLFVLS